MVSSIGDKNLLQKKIIKNPRYEDIGSRIDTGASMTKYLRKLDDIQSNFKIKPNEIFKRIKLSSFAELLLETAMADLVGKMEVQNGEQPVAAENQTNRVEESSNSYNKLQDVISGKGAYSSGDNGKMDVNNNSNSYENSPFLLLDTQLPDDFDKCHIRPAINFDPAELSRTMNPYNKLLLSYINKPNKIIVVYDQNEESAVRVCTNLAERHIQNVYLLSGGLKLIANRNLHVLVTGPYPRSIFSEEIAKAERTRIGGRPKKFTIPGLKETVEPERKIYLEGEVSCLGRDLDSYINSTIAPSTARSVRSVRSTSNMSQVSSRAWR